MNSQSFVRASRRQVSRIAQYIIDQAPGMVIGKTLRFIDGNFRAQGWQGKTFERWQKNRRGGTILVNKGHLRRGMNYAQAGPGAVRFYNNRPYAGIHNRGFKGTVSVKAHTRNQYQKSKVSMLHEFTRSGKHKTRTVTSKTGETSVRAHTRNINMPRRQFAPYEGSESPVLNNSITRELSREISKILSFK